MEVVGGADLFEHEGPEQGFGWAIENRLTRGTDQRDLRLLHDGGSGRAERAELPDRIVPTADAIEQAVANKSREKVPRCGRRSSEMRGRVCGGELSQTVTDELIQQLQPGGLSHGSHSSHCS